MTEKEAVEELQEQISTLESMIAYNTDFEPKSDNARLEERMAAAKTAIAALEKQISKKIVHNPDAGREADWTCPSCKWTCSPYARHCQNCGQALYKED